MLATGQGVSGNGNKTIVNHIKTIVRNKNPVRDIKVEDKNVFRKIDETNAGLHTSIGITDTHLTASDLNSANMRRNGTSQGQRRTTNFFMSNNQKSIEEFPNERQANGYYGGGHEQRNQTGLAKSSHHHATNNNFQMNGKVSAKASA